MDSGRSDSLAERRSASGDGKSRRPAPTLRLIKRGKTGSKGTDDEKEPNPLAFSAPSTASRDASPRSPRSNSPLTPRRNDSPLPQSPRSGSPLPLGSPRGNSPRRFPSPVGSQPNQPQLTKYSTFEPKPSDNNKPQMPVSSLSFSPSAPSPRASSRPSSARFPSKPPPVPARGIKPAPPPVIILRQKSFTVSSKGKKRELGGLGRDQGKQEQGKGKGNGKGKGKAQGKEKEGKEKEGKEGKETAEQESKEKEEKQGEEEDVSDSKIYRRRSEPSIRLGDYLMVKKESLASAIPLFVLSDAATIEENCLGEEEGEFLEQKAGDLSFRLAALEELGKSREKALSERESDLSSLSGLFGVNLGNVLVEGEIDELRKLGSLLSTIELEEEERSQEFAKESQAKEEGEGKNALKQQIEDEFLSIDSLIHTIEFVQPDTDPAEDSPESELAKIFGESATIEGDRTSPLSLQESKELVNSIEWQISKLQEMHTSEQASLSRMEQTINFETSRLLGLKEKKQKRSELLEKLEELSKKEWEIRENVAKESRELDKKSLALEKKKDEALENLLRIRENLTEKNEEVYHLEVAKREQQLERERIKAEQSQAEEGSTKGGRRRGKREEWDDVSLDFQMIELCEWRNQGYKEAKKELLCELKTYKRKMQRQKDRANLTSSCPASSRNSRVLKTPRNPRSAYSPRIKAPTGRRRSTLGMKALRNTSSISSSPSPPALPTRAAPPLPGASFPSVPPRPKMNPCPPLSPTIPPKPNIDFVLNNTPRQRDGGRRAWSQSVNLSNMKCFQESLEGEINLGHSRNCRIGERNYFLASRRREAAESDRVSPLPPGAQENEEEDQREQQKQQEQEKQEREREEPDQQLQQQQLQQRQQQQQQLQQQQLLLQQQQQLQEQQLQDEKGGKKRRKRLSSRTMTSSSFNLSSSPSSPPQGSPSTSPTSSPYNSPAGKISRNSSMSNLKRRLSIGSSSSQKPFKKKSVK